MFAEPPSACPDCGSTGLDAYSQHIYPDHRIGWSYSFRCSKCASQVESDDYGFPPFDIRRLLADQLGVWCLSLDNPTTMRVGAMRAFRQVLSISISSAKALVNTGVDVWIGTEVEVRWLLLALAPFGVAATVRPCTYPSSRLTQFD